MKRSVFRLAAVALAAGVLLASPGSLHAAGESSNQERAEALAREAMDQLLDALGLFLESIPQYEMPEVDDNGDIIIRRKRNRNNEPPAEPEFDETTT